MVNKERCAYVQCGADKLGIPSDPQAEVTALTDTPSKPPPEGSGRRPSPVTVPGEEPRGRTSPGRMRTRTRSPGQEPTSPTSPTTTKPLAFGAPVPAAGSNGMRPLANRLEDLQQ